MTFKCCSKQEKQFFAVIRKGFHVKEKGFAITVHMFMHSAKQKGFLYDVG